MPEADAPMHWRRASRCDSGSCVEVALVRGGAAVRDSKQPEGAPYIMFAAGAWRDFLDGIRAGEFDLPGA